MIPLEGFPLKTITVTTTTDGKGREKVDQSEMNVTVLREETIPAEIFELPAGYREVSLMDPATRNASKLPAEENGGGSPMKALKGLFGGK